MRPFAFVAGTCLAPKLRKISRASAFGMNHASTATENRQGTASRDHSASGRSVFFLGVRDTLFDFDDCLVHGFKRSHPVTAEGFSGVDQCLSGML